MKFVGIKKNHYDLLLIGHIAIDNIKYQNSLKFEKSLGGGVIFGSLAASFFAPDTSIGIISKIGTNFNKNLFLNLQNRKIDYVSKVYFGKKTTEYLIEYFEDGRTLKLISKADKIRYSDFQNCHFSAKAIHFTPITDEISLKLLSKILNSTQFMNSIFGIDIQGFMREFDKDGRKYEYMDKEKRINLFKIIEKHKSRVYIKTSEIEAIILANKENLDQSVEYLNKKGLFLFITLGKKGIIFQSPNSHVRYFQSYDPKECIDETGAGDCFMAVLLIQLSKYHYKQITDDVIIDAIKYASGASSFLIEKKGPEGFQNRKKIKDRIILSK